jgi:hypothetical protein
MLESAYLSNNTDHTEPYFVEREAPSELLTKLGTQLHLSGLSLSNTVRIVGVVDIERAQSTACD